MSSRKAAFFVEFLTEIPDDQIAAHLQVGHGALEVLLSSLAESSPLFELIGEQGLRLGELIHDLLLVGDGENIIPPTVKVVAVPPPVVKIRKPGFGDKARFLTEKLTVGHQTAAGNHLPPLPEITAHIAAPPVLGKDTLLRRKSVDAIAEQEQKSHFVNPVHQFLPAVDTGRTPHDPLPIFYCHPAVYLFVSDKNSVTQKPPWCRKMIACTGELL